MELWSIGLRTQGDLYLSSRHDVRIRHTGTVGNIIHCQVCGRLLSPKAPCRVSHRARRKQQAAQPLKGWKQLCCPTALNDSSSCDPMIPFAPFSLWAFLSLLSMWHARITGGDGWTENGVSCDRLFRRRALKIHLVFFPAVVHTNNKLPSFLHHIERVLYVVQPGRDYHFAVAARALWRYDPPVLTLSLAEELVAAIAAGEWLSSTLGAPSSGFEESLFGVFCGEGGKVSWFSHAACNSAAAFSVLICSEKKRYHCFTNREGDDG